MLEFLCCLELKDDHDVLQHWSGYLEDYCDAMYKNLKRQKFSPEERHGSSGFLQRLMFLLPLVCWARLVEPAPGVGKGC